MQYNHNHTCMLDLVCTEKMCTYLHAISRQNFIVLFVHSTFTVYVPKTQFTQATIDYLATNETKNALHNEAVIYTYIGGASISHVLSN